MVDISSGYLVDVDFMFRNQEQSLERVLFEFPNVLSNSLEQDRAVRLDLTYLLTRLSCLVASSCAKALPSQNPATR